jgi:hypothetical protein
LRKRWKRHRERKGHQSEPHHVEPRKSKKSGGNTGRPTKFLIEQKRRRQQERFPLLPENVGV